MTKNKLSSARTYALAVAIVVVILLIIWLCRRTSSERFGEDPRNYALQSLAQLNHSPGGLDEGIPLDPYGSMNDWDHNYISNLQGWHGWRMPKYPPEANTVDASHPLDEGGEETGENINVHETERVPGQFPNTQLEGPQRASACCGGSAAAPFGGGYSATGRRENFNPSQDEGGLKFLPTPNLRYAPQYLYTLPYSYREGGAYPPNMFTRYNQWQPGYDTAGWSWTMRPGMSYNKWPRNRWVHTNGNHFVINNGTDRSQDYDNAQ
jgi:hypothetical protein